MIIHDYFLLIITLVFNKWLSSPSGVDQHVPIQVFEEYQGWDVSKRRATSETLFSLAFGSEAIIHPNVMVPSISTVLSNFKQNKKEMATKLDLVEERCDKVITLIATYQQQLLSNYNKRARIRQFQPRDLVLKKAFITARWECSKKIAPIWESLYKIS